MPRPAPQLLEPEPRARASSRDQLTPLRWFQQAHGLTAPAVPPSPLSRADTASMGSGSVFFNQVRAASILLKALRRPPLLLPADPPLTAARLPPSRLFQGQPSHALPVGRV